MSNKAFKKMVFLGNQNLNDVQNNVEDAIGPILKDSFLDGAILERVVLTTGNNTISHKFGRKLLGWVITDINAPATIYKVSSDNLVLVLNTTANCTINLRIF